MGGARPQAPKPVTRGYRNEHGEDATRIHPTTLIPLIHKATWHAMPSMAAQPLCRYIYNGKKS